MNVLPTIPIVARHFISDLDARILRDAYGYTVNLPSVEGETYLIDFNETTGALELRGDPTVTTGGTIKITRESNFLRVDVNGRVATFGTTAVTSINVIGGNHALTVEDTTFTDRTWNITSTSITATNIPAITTSGLASLTIEAGDGDDTITVNTNSTINAGAGMDVIKMNGGLVTVNGGADSDDLQVGAIAPWNSSTSARTYTITNNTVTGSATAQVTYQDVQRVVITAGGTLPNRFDVQRTI
jgi:Ca2+-binding RTX toxin-like protein